MPLGPCGKQLVSALGLPGLPHTWIRPLRRTYAISRFPARRTGFGRSSSATRKPRKESEISQPEDSRSDEDTSSLRTKAQPWDNVMGRMGGDPEVGLKRLLSNDALVVTRQLEMLNIFSLDCEPLGYIAEEAHGFLSVFSRQIFRTHRPFRALVMDLEGSPLLWLRRPFAWINSRMFVQRSPPSDLSPPSGQPVLDIFAEVQQEWHLWRRRYNLFLKTKPLRVLTPISSTDSEPESPGEQFNQFARIDEGLLAWNFVLRNSDGDGMATIQRAFRGFGREIFTDTGQYAVSFNAPEEQELSIRGELIRAPRRSRGRDLTLDERAVLNIDYDYFSRHSEG
ncbi:Scramblase-domain-containing protein [Pisolithus orientalis]|uniref:Scramblase-domain-containing protein n=1 Tax=Pisolithus orientalis TaxID=936130 RepID=UPI002224B88D|nr:Scramblase-domain-containing protein [Pisolithus orientalis]KAI6019746.1 Scramblase-domain-containing protein [Pisolithus orientalis]